MLASLELFAWSKFILLFVQDLQKLINAYRSDMVNLSVSNQILIKRNELLTEKIKALNTHDQLGMFNHHQDQSVVFNRIRFASIKFGLLLADYACYEWLATIFEFVNVTF